MISLEEQIQDAAELIQQAQHIVALTGAGISTESGIPDFRSPDSIWQRQPPASYQEFISKPEARQRYWQTRHSLLPLMSTAKPNTAHHALAELAQQQKLATIITQNFDGLHQDAGNPAEQVIELHGTARFAACTHCGTRSSMEELQQRINTGENDPRCSLCAGYLKAATILFGQRIPEDLLMRAKQAANDCDLFLVVGSSLKVTPAATLPRLALKHNVPLIIINLLPTSLDQQADVAIHEKAGPTLAAIMQLI